MISGKFTFGDLMMRLLCGWWYGTLCIHCTKFCLRVTWGGWFKVNERLLCGICAKAINELYVDYD